MSDKDEFDKAAAKCLPCRMINGDYPVRCENDAHSVSCPANFRPAVAAALRKLCTEKDAEIGQVRSYNGQLIADLMGCRDGALVRDLRARVEELEREMERRRKVRMARTGFRKEQL